MAKPGTEAAARAANSCADSHPARDGDRRCGRFRKEQRGTGNSCSPDTCSGERLVTRIRRSLLAPSSSDELASGQDMLEVVQDQQDLAIRQVAGHVLEQ